MNATLVHNVACISRHMLHAVLTCFQVKLGLKTGLLAIPAGMEWQDWCCCWFKHSSSETCGWWIKMQINTKQHSLQLINKWWKPRSRVCWAPQPNTASKCNVTKAHPVTFLYREEGWGKVRTEVPPSEWKPTWRNQSYVCVQNVMVKSSSYNFEQWMTVNK